MNGMDQFKAMFMRVGAGFRSFRILGNSLVIMALALSMAFFGCSAKAGKKTVVAPPDKVDPKVTVTAIDSLVKANKGKGKGIITGFLTGENKSIASGILGKMASNAAGERRMLVNTEIPLTGATILVFNALKPTTAPDTTLKTDTAGNYTAVLPEGKFFGFAVYLDLETFQLVTTSIPNMNPKADTAIKMDTAIAIEDVTAPTVAGVYDASSANSDGIFLVGSVADKGAKLNITFSEPMNRESASKVVLGKIDTTNTSTSMVLADTVKGITISWSGDSKELTLKLPDLAVGTQYGLIMPVSLKDLAKNPLEKEYKATFVTVATATLASVPFTVTATFPEDKGELKPIQNPGISFSRPVEAFSILKGAKIEPAVTGYFEISGARAVFIHKDPLVIGTTYKITLPVTVTDLAGSALGAEYSYTFVVKDFEGAAKTSTGKEKEVALAVEAAFDAYLSGDVGRFGAAFHANFRLYNDDGSMKSKAEFLDMIRKDVGDMQAQAAGFLGPVFDNSAEACKEGANISRWKVGAVGGAAGDQIWVDAFVSPGQSPRAYGLDGVEIPASSLTWDPTGPRFTYKTKVYGFGPDMSKFRGPVNMDAAKEDMRFMGDMLRQTSTVVLADVKLEQKTQFNVDPGVSLSAKGDTAKLAVKMIDYRKFNRVNFGEVHMACSGKLEDTSFQILKFILVNDGSKWLVVSIVSPSKNTTKEDFNKTVSASDFKVKTILPINLIAPLKQDAMTAEGKITFKFLGAKHDTVGGYIVGIAEDPKFCFGRPPYGALIFVKASNTAGTEESFIMNSAGGLEGSNAFMILRRAQDLRLPGWERTMFENAITKMVDVANGFGGVYNWKVIAIKDTSAVQFLANGFNPDRFYGESDFGTARGYFACKAFPSGAAFATLETNQNQFVNTQPPINNTGSFGDMDLDGVPDGMEIKYKTDPKDRNSYPDFRVDTDGDALADFLEAMLDPKGTDSLISKKADAAGVKAEIAKLVTLGLVWMDTDGDGFPDDIEMMSGFNPNDRLNNPGTRARASAPVGVFSGKFQMGSSLNSISFKLYSDTLKLMWVAYTAVIGKDTLVDTVRSNFNEMAGEVLIAVTLPKVGPDAGKALLLRGHYDANTSLLMGPVDMITAVAKTSVNFGGGPYVGQFAASGRGEDVSRYLPGAGGTTGPIVNNPINNPPAMANGYRLPPLGTDTGAVVIFNGTTTTFLDAFGDTLAVVTGAMYRSQPDGSFEFHSDMRISGANNSWKRTEAGGRIYYDGKADWVVDGVFFQETDSVGIHKTYPGQMCARVAKADFTVGMDGAKGSMKGWIAQDKTGAGFVGPVTTTPVCDPAKGPCAPVCDPAKGPCAPVCDPSKGPCTVTPVCDPAKGPCGPVNSFSKPFMSGSKIFKSFLDKALVEPGAYFYVQMGGKVFQVKYDSLHVQDAKAPMCGHVVLVPELIALKDETAISVAARNSDSMSLPTNLTGSIIVALEDQFVMGMPARMDKARDSYGDIRSNVFMVEMRPVSMDYGKTTMVCPANNGTINPVCDPTKQTCTVPCDPTKGTCPEPVCDPTKTTCPQPVCDPTKTTCPQPVCDPTKTTCPQPVCDPTKQVCGPVVGGKPLPYLGAADMIGAALVTSGNKVGLVKDTTGNIGTMMVDPTTVFWDDVKGTTTVKEPGKAQLYLFAAEGTDQKKLRIFNGLPVVYPNPDGTIPVDTNKVVPPDTLKPMPYTGPVSNIPEVLAFKQNKVKVMTPSGLVDATVNPATVISEGGLVQVKDASTSGRVYIFLGAKEDTTKPLLTPVGNDIVVQLKVTVAVASP